jgi:integrase
MPSADSDTVINKPDPGPKQPRLLDEVRTEQAYLHWIRRYIRCSGLRHPRELGGAEVERFLSDLATRARVAPSTQNQALAALLFLYREVLALELPWMEDIVRAKRAPRLPVVLSRAQTTALLSAMRGREALMAGLLYGSGLRLMECLRLRIKDVDFDRSEIVVREGKGGRIAGPYCRLPCGTLCRHRSNRPA